MDISEEEGQQDSCSDQAVQNVSDQQSRVLSTSMLQISIINF
jgi:hypothetical protein